MLETGDAIVMFGGLITLSVGILKGMPLRRNGKSNGDGAERRKLANEVLEQKFGRIHDRLDDTVIVHISQVSKKQELFRRFQAAK